MISITKKLNKLNCGLQVKIFTFEEKLKIYYEEIQNQVLHNFQTITKAKQDGINISSAYKINF